MSTHRPTRSHRLESVARGMLALALLAAVAWALAGDGGLQQGYVYFSSLRGF